MSDPIRLPPNRLYLKAGIQGQYTFNLMNNRAKLENSYDSMMGCIHYILRVCLKNNIIEPSLL
jgi:hypothetical protein